MSFEYVTELLSPTALKEEVPLDDSLKQVKSDRDTKIQDIISGKSDKFLLIIGPCSAHNADAVCEYTGRLAKLQEKVEEKLVLSPRIYTNKPRTTGEGYKGMAHQADHKGESNFTKGLVAMREMHVRSLKESHLSAADEMLYPGNYPYLDDILSYVAIGARSVENQEHRLTVSGLDVPTGMKNPMRGDIEIMMNAIRAAQLPHDFIYNGWSVKTSGNPYAHGILRGALDLYGRNIPNYHYEDLVRVIEAFEERSLTNPSVIIDTNHENSNRKFHEQPRIAYEILRSRKASDSVKKYVKGLMVESYLIEGKQKEGENTFGKSITDPCLGWESSEDMVMKIADMV